VTPERLAELRSKIDNVDERLMNLLEERWCLVSAVAKEKRAAHLPPLDDAREEEIVERFAQRARHVPRADAKGFALSVLSACRKAIFPTVSGW